MTSIQRPAAQRRIRKLMDYGFQEPGPLETALGHAVGQLGDAAELTPDAA
jgi:hypothetical protein